MFGGLQTRFWFNMIQKYDRFEILWIYSPSMYNPEAKRKKCSENCIPSKYAMEFRGETKAISSVRTCKTPFRDRIAWKHKMVTKKTVFTNLISSTRFSGVGIVLFARNFQSSWSNSCFGDDFGTISTHVLRRFSNILSDVEQILTAPKFDFADGKKSPHGLLHQPVNFRSSASELTKWMLWRCQTALQNSHILSISSSGKFRGSHFKLKNGSREKKSSRAFAFNWMYSKLKLWKQFPEAVAMPHCVTISERSIRPIV